MKILLFLFLTLQLFGNYYNSTMIEIEAKLFPKMMIFSADIDKKSKILKIEIVAHAQDYRYAQEFKEAIKSNYPDKLMNRALQVSITELSKMDSSSDAIIVLNHTEKELVKIATFANSRKIPSFAYNPFYMDSGILASLYIGRTTKPYLNKDVMQKYNFTFNPYLLKLSRFR